ncbi:DDE-type integrase/transposase/recombinase [Massilia buxea]|uniref:DDE-type integrase/transposase/recombinase n=1 Tax=Pseudoduganella buxea TaxID=1949069 RepID=A0A6I3T6M2_9BURK|nr:DDE-type integrase/transposase/recombinase [Pseudoduganella buxea]
MHVETGLAAGDQLQHARFRRGPGATVAIDDHARIAYTELYPDESQDSARRVLANAHACYCSLGARPKRLLSDNGSAFRARSLSRAGASLELKHGFTEPYRPQTNGKAERFIQSALREWAYGFIYKTSSERAIMLRDWSHHYNWHRPHQESVARRQCPGSQPTETSSCNFTASAAGRPLPARRRAAARKCRRRRGRGGRQRRSRRWPASRRARPAAAPPAPCCWPARRGTALRHWPGPGRDGGPGPCDARAAGRDSAPACRRRRSAPPGWGTARR